MTCSTTGATAACKVYVEDTDVIRAQGSLFVHIPEKKDATKPKFIHLSMKPDNKHQLLKLQLV